MSQKLKLHKLHKLEYHYNWNVTKIGMLNKNWNMTKIGMTLKLECH